MSKSPGLSLGFLLFVIGMYVVRGDKPHLSWLSRLAVVSDDASEQARLGNLIGLTTCLARGEVVVATLRLTVNVRNG